MVPRYQDPCVEETAAATNEQLVKTDVPAVLKFAKEALVS